MFDLSVHGEAITPFWKSGKMCGETAVMYVEWWSKGPAVARLAFEPLKIERVTNYIGDVVYEEGKDYLVDGRTIIRTENSSIPYLHYNQILGEGAGDGLSIKGEKTMLYTEGDFMCNHQIAVTYTLDTSKIYNFESNITDRLPKTLEKLKSKEPFNLVFYGDSVTFGCSCSEWQELPPHQPPYAKIVHKALCEEYGDHINYINTALGGSKTDWGLKNVDDHVCDYNPDLVVLAFGCNDGISMDANHFKKNLKAIIERIREKCGDDVEFLIVDCYCPSRHSLAAPGLLHFNTQQYFKYTNEELVHEFTGVDKVKMGSLHEMMIAHKEYFDFFINNINHPGDFFHRIIAQTVLSKLVEY